MKNRTDCLGAIHFPDIALVQRENHAEDQKDCFEAIHLQDTGLVSDLVHKMMQRDCHVVSLDQQIYRHNWHHKDCWNILLEILEDYILLLDPWNEQDFPSEHLRGCCQRMALEIVLQDQHHLNLEHSRCRVDNYRSIQNLFLDHYSSFHRW